MIDQWTVYWLERLTNIYYTTATVLVLSLIVFIVSLSFVVAGVCEEFRRQLYKPLLIAGVGIVLSAPAVLFIPTSREYAAMKAAMLAGTPEGARAMPVLEVYLKDRRKKTNDY